MPSFMKVVMTENGEEIVPMSQAEIDQWNADQAAAQAAQAAQAAEEKSISDTRAQAIADARTHGWSDAMIAVMFP